MGLLLLGRDDPQVLQLLRVPEGYGLMAATGIGYPAVTPPAPPRKAVQIEWVRQHLTLH